jgi:hypothetical protein
MHARGLRDGSPDDPHHGPPEGRPSLDDGPPDWLSARLAVVPLLARSHPLAALTRPVTVDLEPGLRVGFGVDLGPMFLHVTEPMLTAWQVDAAQLTRRAIGNLRRLAGALPDGSTQTGRVGVTPLAVLQAPGGWASSLLLAPDLLPRWFGSVDGVFLAPARNMLVGLPGGTDGRLARWLRDEIAARLPDALEVPVLRWSAGRITVVDPHRPRGERGRVAGRPPRPGSSWRARAQGARTTWYRPPDRSVT